MQTQPMKPTKPTKPTAFRLELEERRAVYERLELEERQAAKKRHQALYEKMILLEAAIRQPRLAARRAAHNLKTRRAAYKKACREYEYDIALTV